jgi:hypothetical protein
MTGPTTPKGGAVFKNKPPTSARESAAVHHRVASLNRTADSWYDGTVESIDARVDSVTRVIADCQNIVARDSQSPFLETLLQQREAQTQLFGMRRELLGGFDSHRVASRPVVAEFGDEHVTPWVREFVATRLSAFLADNEDARYDAEELDVRAAHYADLHSDGRDRREADAAAFAFRRAVSERVESAPVTREASAPPDHPDYLLYG